MESLTWPADGERADMQSAVRRLTGLALEIDAREIFFAVSKELGRVVNSDAAWLIHFDVAGSSTVLAVWNPQELSLPVGTQQPLSDELRAVRDTGLPYRFDAGATAPVSSFTHEAHRLGITSCMGVPVLLAGQVWGLAVAAMSSPRAFPVDGESRMTHFADLVAPTLAHAHSLAQSRLAEGEQRGLRRVAELAVSGLPPEKVLEAVAVEASVLMDGGAVTMVRLEDDGQNGVIVAVSGDHAPLGLRFAIDGDNAAARILRSGRPERIDDYASVRSASLAEDLGVRAAVGVPITIGGQLWGMIGAVSADGPLPAGTERRLARFAEIASAAISSAQTRDDFQQLADEQAALLRVAQLVARGTAEAELFDAVATEASGLIGGEGANLVRFDGPRTFTIIATCGGPAPVGFKFEIPEDDEGTASEVIRTHRPARRDNYLLTAAPLFSDGPYGLGSSVSVPIIVEGRLWGLLGCVTEGRRLPTGTERRLQQFAELVAAAIANAQARAEVQQLADEQSALLRVAELVARGASGPELFDAVATEAAGLINDEATTLVRYEGNRTFTIIATRGGPVQVGTSVVVPPDDEGSMSRMLREKRPNRLDDYTSEPGPHFTRERYGLGSAVSVPIIVEGELWGMLGCLTEGRRLPAGTEDRLQKFAELVTAAIANSQARAEMQHLADDQAAFRRAAELVARDAPVNQVFAEVATETSRVLGGMAAALLRFDPDGFAVVVATHDSPAALGLRIPIDSHAGVGGLFRSGRPFRIDSFEHSDLAEIARELGVTSGVAAPIIVEGGVWGALTTSASGAAFPANCEEQLEQFAALAAVAITNAGNKAKLTASRARVVATADETRRRLQRDVHDGAQQRLVQTVITLKLGRDAAAKGKPAAGLINEALRHAERANAELRELVHGILPASLSRSGLRSGLESLIADMATPVDLEFSAPRLLVATETTAYFIVAEALANVVKHAAASQVRVRVNVNALSLIVEVSDDGVGGADATRGSGLTGLQDRIDAAGGTLTIASELGSGTTLRASLPVDAVLA